MITLRPYQESAVLKLIETPKGIVKAPCGSGKTIVAAEALRRVLQRSGAPRFVYWLCNTNDQAAQALQALELCLGHYPGTNIHVGHPTAGADFPPEAVDILIVDECHHAAAPTWRQAIERCRKAVRWGFSATPNRADELKQVVYTLLGPIVHKITRKELDAAGVLVGAKVTMIDSGPDQDLYDAVVKRSGIDPEHIRIMKSTQQAWSAEQDADFRAWAVKYVKSTYPNQPTADMIEQCSRNHWLSVVKLGIADNVRRNDKVVDGVRYHIANGDSILVIVSAIRQGEYLAGKIGLDCEVIHSKLGKKRRRELIEEFREGTLPCLLATSLADEGLDVPRAQVLFLATGGRSRRQAEQRTGRVLRSFKEKRRALIYDFVDSWHPWLRSQARARMSVYKQLGYEILIAAPARASPLPKRAAA